MRVYNAKLGRVYNAKLGRVYNAKLGTVPTFVQLRHRYALLKGDRVLYRQVYRSNGGWVSPVESWQPGLVDEDYPYPDYPYPHKLQKLLRLSQD